MQTLPNFVDMSVDNDDEDSGIPEVGQSQYPYGLCICLTDAEIEKLDLDDDCDVGDMISFEAIAKVTAVSKRDTGTRIELQIIAMANDGDDEPEPVRKLGQNRPY